MFVPVRLLGNWVETFTLGTSELLTSPRNQQREVVRFFVDSKNIAFIFCELRLMWFSDYLFSNALTTWEEKFAQGMWVLDVFMMFQGRGNLGRK
jgi:hypothetical protein